MKSALVRLLCGTILTVSGAGLCAQAQAASASPGGSAPAVVLDSQVRFQGIDDNNAGFGTGRDNSALAGVEARLKLTAKLSENSLFYWEGRGVAGAGHAGFETSDTGAVSDKKNFLEWRQSYLEFDNLDGQPLAARLGRQRIKESYGDWWNRDFDAVRLSYDTTLFSGFAAAGQNLFSYNSAEEFDEDQKDIFRAMAEGSWQYHYQQFIEARMMYEDDHSGIDSVGTIHPASDGRQAEGRLFWAGLRAAGEAGSFMQGADKIRYRVDLRGVGGNEDQETTAASGSSNLIITGKDSRDVLGWGLDAGVDIPVANAKPLIHLGYAYGSGGDASGDDHAFRQPGLAGNFSRMGALSQSTYNYGSVLRPELSNIHVLTAGVTTPLLQASDGGIVYHYYRLADTAAALPSSGVNNVLNGSDHDLGHAVDFLFNSNLYQDNDIRAGHINKIYLRTSVGAFRAGSAYGSNEGEFAGRGLVELGFDF
jgi:hypothetical protein